jgi:transglutaminase-like putative cysteine protease
MSQIELASHQVSRRSVPWMLLAVVAALLPHVTHLPWWLQAVSVACLAWRWGVHSGRVSYPPRRLQVLFALALLAGVYLQYRTVAGHQAGTAMLVAMFSLKLLEMYRERDAYVVVVLGYFVAAMAFLFHFSLWMGFYVLLVSTLLTAALIAINMTLDAPRFEPLRRASVMLAQSIPIAILLFVVMPRLGPLWATGLKPGDAKTGMTDVMSPGSVGSLARSDELAFRVDFDGAVPPASQLYWRGLTLGEYDGTSWRQLPGIDDQDWATWYFTSARPDWLKSLQAEFEKADPSTLLNYTVILQPTQQTWLFALDAPMTKERNVGVVFDHRLRTREPVKTLMRYQVQSLPGLHWDVDPPRWFLDYHRRLPTELNPRARQWALLERAALPDDAAYIKRVLALFANEGFAYTLNPPRLGEHNVDDFLFGTRRGFCEHYASSFVFLMRAAGIPARVVAGYQGGEVNDLSGTVQVRQYDAHAWAEVWLPDVGWNELDPTAVVAPERIAEGSRASLGLDTGMLGFSADSVIGGSLQAMSEAIDFLNHGWNSWVLGFDDQAQKNFFREWLGNLSPYRIGLMVLGFGIVFVGGLIFWMFREDLFRRVDPVAREYERFCAGWAARGVTRAAGEGPYDYLQRVQASDARRATDVQRFIVLYVGLTYAGKAPDSKTLQRLRAARIAAM